MAEWPRCVRAKCALLLVYATAAVPAMGAAALSLARQRFELRPGEAAELGGATETLDFLKAARTRRIVASGAAADGLFIGTNTAGHTVISARLRAKPGEYAVTISATGAGGEVREAAATVEVKPLISVPSTATRPPVVLLNGWQTGFTNACNVSTSSSDTFGNLAQYLVADGVPVVYLFDNCLEDPNQSIETLGNDLGAFLNTIQYDNGAQVPQIDLVAFSMGGLIARSYLAGLQPSGAITPPVNTLVRKLALIATPNFGAYVAANYATSVLAGSQSAELVPGSAFLWNLANWNQRSDDLRGVSAIAVIGNAGEYSAPSVGTVLNNAGDGVVSLASASAGFVNQQDAVTRIVPYCHIDAAAFTNTSFGTYLCSAAGIANVTSEAHYTSRIVRSFLSGTNDWQSIGGTPGADPYLSKNGGMYFALQNAGGGYASDLTQVTWGTLQLTNGGDTSTIYYQDFAAGAGNLNVSSGSLGSLNCGAYSQPPGFFSAVRCKVDAAIFSIGPLLSSFPKLVSAGSAITITGNDFSGKCIGCKITATPAGSSTGQTLTVNSWTNTAITAVLPASMTGLITISVFAATGSDSLAIMAAGPTVTAVANAASGQPAFAAATWLSIFGTDLANTTYTWQASDFVNGALPTSLQGVSVKVNGKPALVEYVSPTQVNALAPDDLATGTASIQVTNGQQTSNTASATEANFAPGVFHCEQGRVRYRGDGAAGSDDLTLWDRLRRDLAGYSHRAVSKYAREPGEYGPSYYWWDERDCKLCRAGGTGHLPA